MADIYRALGGPWELAAQIDDSAAPDREVHAELTCHHLEPNPDSVYDTPCGWSGFVVVALFEDTKEAIWFCGNDHENSGDFA